MNMAATLDTAQSLGFRPFHEFDEANEVWPRGDRREAMRSAAEEFRRRFRQQGQVRAVKSVDLAAAPYPVKLAFGGAAKKLNPYINFINRLVVIQFDDFDGRLRTLVFQPAIPDGSREAPFYAILIDRYGEFISNRFAIHYHTLDEALAICGLEPADVDYVTFDHLHLQDLRPLLGTRAPDGNGHAQRPLFPKAKFLWQRKEMDTFASMHPMQWPWYVPGCFDDVIEDDIVLLDGDIELGIGIALMTTPGHTDGNQTLVFNTPDGVWVSSENGVCADNWHPEHSTIPGVRKWSKQFRREVILNSNTLEDSIDQYDSMIKEKAVADENRRDPRYRNVIPSSEIGLFKIQWPVIPSFFYGGVSYGTIEKPARGEPR
jgi:glyoxylase-like metal-dependent hydrolase (beta-lactamase superfamily II)